MASYEPTDESHFTSFCLFIIIPKIVHTCTSDRGCWDVNVCEKIYDWTPGNEDLDEVRWIDRLMWVLDVLSGVPTGLNKMTASEILKSGEPPIRSAATFRSWALLLATTLEQLERSVTAMKDAREKKQTEQEVKEIGSIHGWCQRLYLYVYWKEDVVKTLAQYFHERYVNPVPFFISFS